MVLLVSELGRAVSGRTLSLIIDVVSAAAGVGRP